jgi:hypothetical protein
MFTDQNKSTTMVVFETFCLKSFFEILFNNIEILLIIPTCHNFCDLFSAFFQK